MTLRYNFSAGPSPLPAAVIEQVRADLPEWRGQGTSILEISHRSHAFSQVVEETDTDLRTLLQLPDHYHILWLQGGASSQFSLVPMNLGNQHPGGYVLTGSWSLKARAAADYHPAANGLSARSLAGDAAAFDQVPALPAPLDSELAYVHVTANETIHGVQYHQDVDTAGVPLVVDSSSDFLSRPPVFNNFGLMYAGAQKNLGPAGVTVVIVRDDLLQRSPDHLAPMFNYRLQAAKQSLYNTPPVFSWYVCGLVLRWLREQGGLAAMARRNRAKADLLYAEIDRDGFYRSPVQPAHRSQMNVPIRIHDPDLENRFLQQAEAQGFIGLKGHRSVGGLRASLYNAVSLEQTQALVDFMQTFRSSHG